MLNVITRPSADSGSDHQMLCAKFKIRLKSKGKQTRPLRYDVTNIPEAFTIVVQNKYSDLLEMDEEKQGPEELWEEMVKVTKEAAETCIPKKGNSTVTEGHSDTNFKVQTSATRKVVIGNTL